VQTNVVAKSSENIQFEGADEYNLQYLLLHLAPFSVAPVQGAGYVMFSLLEQVEGLRDLSLRDEVVGLREVSLRDRGGCTLKLMKWKLQGPYLARAPSEALGRAIAMPYKCPEILLFMYETNLIKVFPHLMEILKIYITLPITSCEAERNFCVLSVIKSKFLSTMLEERLNYLSVLSIENDINKIVVI
jgi:hypothetical protein